MLCMAAELLDLKWWFTDNKAVIRNMPILEKWTITILKP
jgi:hypothetical protein